jgi:hypothetical protein
MEPDEVPRADEPSQSTGDLENLSDGSSLSDLNNKKMTMSQKLPMI